MPCESCEILGCFVFSRWVVEPFRGRTRGMLLVEAVFKEAQHREARFRAFRKVILCPWRLSDSRFQDLDSGPSSRRGPGDAQLNNTQQMLLSKHTAYAFVKRT